MERNPSQNDQRDRQLERLAGQLRDTGTAPDRDLWPGIEAAIDLEEQGSGRGAPRLKKGNRLLRFAAMAAALTLMLGVGWVGIRTITGDAARLDIAGLSEEAQPSGLAVISQALDDLYDLLSDVSRRLKLPSDHS